MSPAWQLEDWEVLLLAFVLGAVLLVALWASGAVGAVLLAVATQPRVARLLGPERVERLRESVRAGRTPLTVLGAYRAYLRGDMVAATAAIEGCSLEALRAQPVLWNSAVCILIAAGKYRAALALVDHDWRQHPEGDLIRINEAEALQNLGDLDASLSHAAADRVAANRAGAHPYARTGAALHRAWVLAVLGRAPEARASLDAALEKELPGEFRAEYHFTAARVALAESNVSRALLAVEQGLARSERASSQRNGLFLKAQVLQAAGRDEEALALYAQGAAHEYKGQGGDALLAWGDLLARRGRESEARWAWNEVLVRDPESAAAKQVPQRLAAPGEPVKSA